MTTKGRSIPARYRGAKLGIGAAAAIAAVALSGYAGIRSSNQLDAGDEAVAETPTATTVTIRETGRPVIVPPPRARQSRGS